jgi:hypothetical protein
MDLVNREEQALRATVGQPQISFFNTRFEFARFRKAELVERIQSVFFGVLHQNDDFK